MGSIIDNQLRLTFRILCLKIDVALEKVLSRYCTMIIERILNHSQRRRIGDTRSLFSPSRISNFVQKLQNFQRCPIRAIPLCLYVKVFHRYSLFGQYTTPTVTKTSTPYRNIYYATSVYDILH